MEINIGGLRELHPFKNKNGYIYIPRKYRDLYEEMIDDIHYIPYTIDNIEKLIHLYISIFWLDSWYNDDVDFTFKTGFYKLNDANVNFDSPKFARLNSVSSKTVTQVKSLNQAKNIIFNSNRCKISIENARKYNLPIYIAIRDWIDMDTGCEFRCFIYQCKLTAICSSDDKYTELNDVELIARIKKLLDKAQYYLPFQDCIMDVFLSDIKDYIIEFNSYGVWANGASGLFNWITDQYDLENADIVSMKINRIVDL